MIKEIEWQSIVLVLPYVWGWQAAEPMFRRTVIFTADMY